MQESGNGVARVVLRSSRETVHTVSDTRTSTPSVGNQNEEKQQRHGILLVS